MIAREPLTDRLLTEGVIPPDTMALGVWPSEYHPDAGKPSQWQAIGGDSAYGITLAQLRGIDRPNLFGAARVLSGERTAAASARVIGTAFATGHAAGVTAALHALDPGEAIQWTEPMSRWSPEELDEQRTGGRGAGGRSTGRP